MIIQDLWRNPSYYVVFQPSKMEKLETGSGCNNFTPNISREELPDIRTRNNPLGHKDILYYTRVYILKDRRVIEFKTI
jgi:hypothetical protein